MDREAALKFISNLLLMMTQKKASDLFITVGFPPGAKIDGKIVPLAEQSFDRAQCKEIIRALMNDRQAAEFDRTKESNFAIAPTNLGRFRVNAYVQQGNPAMVLRAINMKVPKLEDIGLPSVLSKIALEKRGLVVFVGGTGTGKTTSMAAMLDHRNANSSGHIITLEDPIEFVHKHKSCIVTQREIGTDSDSWEVALKNALRQAPDVILMGEIRDKDTMEQAIAFSETGHLCMATLHANNANQALERILNFFPKERHSQLLMDLSLNLKAMVSQRLIPLKKTKGRAAAIEILINTPLMSELIFNGDIKKMKELMKNSRELGMQTFDQHLFDLHESETISYTDALRFADSENDLKLSIRSRSRLSNEIKLLDNLPNVEIMPSIKRHN